MPARPCFCEAIRPDCVGASDASSLPAALAAATRAMLPHHAKEHDDDLGLFDDYIHVGRWRINPCLLSQAIFASVLLLFMTKALGIL